MCSSVDSGVISEREPMKVVLPTAKCPTTRTLTAVCSEPLRTYASSAREGLETIEHLLKKIPVGERSRGHWRTGDQVAPLGEGAEQNFDDTERVLGVRGDLGDREVAA